MFQQMFTQLNPGSLILQIFDIVVNSLQSIVSNNAVIWAF